MKVRTTKICAAEGCNKEFKLYKTTDKYCYEHAYQFKKSPKKKSKPIKRVSDKLAKEQRIYNKNSPIFLALPENEFCIVAKAVFNEVLLTSENHHKKGRIGKLLNYKPYWLAVSDKGHNWIHNNPEEAYRLGFLIPSTSVNIN